MAGPAGPAVSAVDDAPPHAAVAPLTVTLGPAGQPGGRVVQLSGRLDASTAPDLRRALAAADATSGAGDLVVVDAGGVEAAEPAGLAPLVLAQRRATARSYQLVLVDPSPAMVVALRRSHLWATFTTSTSRTSTVPDQRGADEAAG